ncbi:GGDEF domain-containing protein [Magnetococcus sp. PR-3]|uniref:GGDEF domain-containing protein n=1 Tax=Magnetococcus sp. PR-3 TaxID=3120355 RepID=UPI002FCE3117
MSDIRWLSFLLGVFMDRRYTEIVDLMSQQDNRLDLISALNQVCHRFYPKASLAFWDLYTEHIPNEDTGEMTLSRVLIDPTDLAGREYEFESLSGAEQAMNRGRCTMHAMSEPCAMNRIILPLIQDHNHAALMVIDVDKEVRVDFSGLKLVGVLFLNLQSLIAKKDQDPLTSLLNRRSFDETVATVLAQCASNEHSGRTSGGGACLASFDIDFFKRINDNYGHAIGDEVLILFAQHMRRVFRHSDKLFRFGGEEFIAILLDVDEAKAQAALTRFREEIGSFDFPQAGRVTVSIGYTMVTASDFPTVLMERADRALYYAKANGRNRSCHFEALVAQGALDDIQRETAEVDLW